jgi:hypothetical protein
MPLIAISGKMKSGKTTLSRALSERLGIPIDSFAAPIKAAMYAIGIDPVNDKRKARPVMQAVSTAVTDQDAYHFVAMLANRNARLRDTGLIIDDLRRVSELHWATDEGFIKVRLLVDAQLQLLRGADLEFLDHITETQLDCYHPVHATWDYVVTPETPVEQAVEGIVGFCEDRGFQVPQRIPEITDIDATILEEVRRRPALMKALLANQRLNVTWNEY